MFGIDLSEMLLIVAVAVVVIGPKDLPKALYAAGKVIRKIKLFTSDIQASLDKIIHDEELNEITRHANVPGGENLQFEIDRQLAEENLRKEAQERLRKEEEERRLIAQSPSDKRES